MRRAWMVVALVATLTVAPPGGRPAAAAEFDGPSAVFVSKTSSKVTIIAKSLRKDITLQPTRQVLAGDFGSDGDVGTAFLYNPGSGKDGMLRYGVVDGKITHTFTPMPVNGSYRPFVIDFNVDQISDIFWYGPGDTPDYLWQFAKDGTHTEYRQEIDGNFTPVLVRTVRPGSDFSQPIQWIIWYAPGPATDRLWATGSNGSHYTGHISISGYYRALVGTFARTNLGMESQDIVWYSQDGPDYLWHLGETLDRYGTTRLPDIGPGARPTVGYYLPSDVYATETILWYFPGSKPETFMHQAKYGDQNLTVYPAGNLNGDYRVAKYTRNDVFLLGSGTTAKILHIGSSGIGGSIPLADLPPAATVAVNHLGS